MTVSKDKLLRASGVILFMLLMIVNFFVEVPDVLYILISIVCVVLILWGMALRRKQEDQDKRR